MESTLLIGIWFFKYNNVLTIQKIHTATHDSTDIPSRLKHNTPSKKQQNNPPSQSAKKRGKEGRPPLKEKQQILKQHSILLNIALISI